MLRIHILLRTQFSIAAEAMGWRQLSTSAQGTASSQRSQYKPLLKMVQGDVPVCRFVWLGRRLLAQLLPRVLGKAHCGVIYQPCTCPRKVFSGFMPASVLQVTS